MHPMNNPATCVFRVLPIEQLIPAPYNPRLTLEPESSAYRKLEDSLREFGLVEPLIWNEATGHVVGGHARLRILQNMGVREVAVSVVQLTPAREKALNIVLNNQEAQGRYAPTKLAALLTELAPLPERTLTGFGTSTLKSLHLQPEPALAPLVESREHVHVTLEMPPATYARLEAALNALIQEHNLVSHVRSC